jgi:ankyrin repeat protein
MLAVSAAKKLLTPSWVFTKISEKDGYTSLYSASLYGHLEVVKFLVVKGANINASREFSSETSDGCSPEFQRGTDTPASTWPP